MQINLHNANEYFLSRLNSEAWFNADSDKRMSAISMAKDIIFRLPFIGVKAQQTQNEPFPRNFNGNILPIPDDIIKAIFEETLNLLINSENNTINSMPEGVQAFSLGTASITFKNNYSNTNLSERAKLFLEPWLKKGFDVAPASFNESY